MSALPAPRLPDDGLDVSYVQGPDVRAVWPLVGMHILAALDDTLTEREVYDLVYDGDALLWVVHGVDKTPVATLCTREVDRNGRRVLEVLTAGGSSFWEWAGDLVMPILEQRAHDAGCHAIRAVCRRGMAKWLKALDWRERQIIMEYPTDGR